MSLSKNPILPFGHIIDRYRDGVVVGADSRTSVSGYVSNRVATKISFILENDFDTFALPPSSTMQYKSSFLQQDQQQHDGIDKIGSIHGGNKALMMKNINLSTCCVCRSGSAADTQYLADAIRHQLLRRKIVHSRSSCVSDAAHLIKNYLLSNDSMSASLICAGYDHLKEKGLIYSIDLGGTLMEQTQWACNGSGSGYILGMLDDGYPKMKGGRDNIESMWNEQEAIEFVKKAIGLAMDRDGSSGGVIRVYVINREGKRGFIVFPNERSDTKDDKGKIDEVTNLGKFAPSVRR